MASKKDKFGKKIRSSLKKSLGEEVENEKSEVLPRDKKVDKSKIKAPVKNDNIEIESTNETEIDLPTSVAPQISQNKEKQTADSTLDPDSKSGTNSKSDADSKSTTDVKSDVDSKSATSQVEHPMPRNRDSIYNVSTDIRLEDYTENNDSDRNFAGTARFLAGLILVGLIGWGGYHFSGLLFAPEYQLAITNEEVDQSATIALNEQQEVILSAARPVFIRFQWQPGQLSSDYLKIKILSSGQPQKEIAVMGRMTPVTVNYILFAGPLESGKYSILVEDRSGTNLMSRMFLVR